MNDLLTPPERVAIARLHAMLELLPAALDKRLTAAGVTAFEYILLESLSEADGARLRLSELASKTNASLPRISRVVTSLERRGLIQRAPCEADGRAINAVLTESGAQAYLLARGLYADAVRELVLSGLKSVPGDGVTQLADISYAVLSSLDTARLEASQMADRGFAADPAADPASGPAATDPLIADCAADPKTTTDCAADPLIAGHPVDSQQEA